MNISRSNSSQEKDPSLMNFDEFFRQRCRVLEEEAELNDIDRLGKSIEMNMRKKGDMFGRVFNDGGGRSVEYVPVDGSDLLQWQIFEQTVRANNANILNVKTQYTWEAAAGNPEFEPAAEVAAAIADVVRERFLTEDVREGMAELAQLSHCYFLFSDWDPNATTYRARIPKFRKVKIPLTSETYKCPACGYQIGADDYKAERELRLQGQMDDAQNQLGQMAEAAMAEGMDIPPEMAVEAEQVLEEERENLRHQPAECFECGEVMEPHKTLEITEQEVHDGYTFKPIGDLQFELVSSFEMLVDTRSARRGNLDDADWLCWRRLMPLYKVADLYGDLVEEGHLKMQNEHDWSEHLQWLRALETSSNKVAKTNSQLVGIDRLIEVKSFFFSKAACYGWKEPEGWKAEGKHPFEIKPGETVEDAVMRNFKKSHGLEEFQGIRIDIIDEHIVRVAPACIREQWKAGHWLVNATGFYGKGLEAMLDLQQIVNEYLNMMYEHDMHECFPHTIIDGMMFDHNDFNNRPGHVSYTRPGLTNEKGIGAHIFRLDPPQQSGSVFNLWSYILGPGKQDISAVTAGSVGHSDPNVKTATGQQLSIQRALGMVTPYFKNEKRAVRGFLENMVRLAQKHWPDEAYRSIKSGNGEEMKDADIAKFREARIGFDIRIKDVDGTDIPRTQVEMFDNYAIALKLGLFAPAEMSGIPADVQADMLKILHIDYDPDNYIDHKRIAYSRIRMMVEAAETRYAEALMSDGSVDPNIVTEILLSIPFLPKQDAHLVHLGILDAHCVAESAKPAPNNLLLALLQARATEHGTAIEQMQAANMAKQAAAEGQAKAANKQASGEADREAFEAEMRLLNAQNGKGDVSMSDEDRELAVAEKLFDAYERERDREYSAEEAEKRRRHEQDLIGAGV